MTTKTLLPGTRVRWRSTSEAMSFLQGEVGTVLPQSLRPSIADTALILVLPDNPKAQSGHDDKAFATSFESLEVIDEVSLSREDLDVLLNDGDVAARVAVVDRLRRELHPPVVTTYTVTITHPGTYTETYPAESMRRVIERAAADDLTIEVEQNR